MEGRFYASPQAGRSEHTGGPRDSTTTPKVTKDTQAESTNADIREAAYLTEKVRVVERNEERCREDSGP